MKKLILLIVLFLLSFTAIAGDPDWATKCGDPSYYSDFFIVGPKGTVVKVKDPITVVIKKANGYRVTIHLAGLVTPPKDSEKWLAAKKRLSELVLGKTVQYNHRLSQKRRMPRFGQLSSNDGDVGLLLIAEGLLRYNTTIPYAVDSYSACLYQAADEHYQNSKQPQ